jgi:uncharacterized damage-inducible protein DinB
MPPRRRRPSLPAEPSSVSEVLDRTRIEWAALQDVVSRLSDAELASPGPEEWAVKDHLAHIAEWERGCTAVLEHRPQWQGFQLAEADYTTLDTDIDALNAVLYARHRDESITDVKSLGNAAHADILAALSHLSDADLQRPVADFGMLTNPERKLLEKIAGDTYEHYAEHTTWIGELLRSRA